MKRSKALAPLSREHHEALVVARELTRATPETAVAAAERFVRFLAQHELAHFAAEERALLPVLGSDEPERSLARRLREDHEYLRDAMRRLRAASVEPTAVFAEEVGARLRAHVQMEERELFPHLERTLDPAALDEVGALLADAPKQGPAHAARAFLGAVGRRDLPGTLALADPAIEFHPLRLTGTPAYRGHGGIRRWLEDLARVPYPVSFVADDVHAVDDEHAVAGIRLVIGEEELAEATALFTVANGRVTEVQGFFSDEGLLARVGHL